MNGGTVGGNGSAGGRSGGAVLPKRLTSAARRRGLDVMAAWRRDGQDPPELERPRLEPFRTWPAAAEAVWYRPQDGRFAEPAEVLVVEGLSLHFGGVHALNGVDLRARTGEVTGVIGPNGAGKSTLFNCLSGLLTPDSGRITFEGTPLAGAPARRAQRGLGRTFQTPRLFKSLSVLDNLLFGCETADWSGHRYVFDSRLGRLPQAERATRIARLVGFRGDLSAPAGALPFGDLRTVELARALCGAPQLLMLDEPASGLDTEQAERFVGLMSSLAAMGLAILLIEHDMALVMELCRCITVLDFGQVIAVGTPDEVQRDDAVIRAYLGRSGSRA
jgi:ABC-type branched-subunit amino acid transport system ATPase component